MEESPRNFLFISQIPGKGREQAIRDVAAYQYILSSSMAQFVGDVTAGLASFELVGLDCRDMFAAEISDNFLLNR